MCRSKWWRNMTRCRFFFRWKSNLRFGRLLISGRIFAFWILWIFSHLFHSFDRRNPEHWGQLQLRLWNVPNVTKIDSMRLTTCLTSRYCRQNLCILTTGGSVVEWSARQTRSPAAPGSSPSLATCWICSWSSRVQILGHACKYPTGCLLPVGIFNQVIFYLHSFFLIIWVEYL